MAKQKSKRKKEPTIGEVVGGFAEAVDIVFTRFTGKPVAAWLKEFRQRPRELPPGDQVSSSDTMQLADAYAILGLTPSATLEQVKKHYRNLAWVFHSDKSGMNDEAMKLLNRAYERITKGGGGK